jgi:lipooligosaccharide transport system permease protein
MSEVRDQLAPERLPGRAATSRLLGHPRWTRALAYYASSYKRTWRSSVTTSFLYPVLYLAAMGVGLGSLVNRHVHTVGGVHYLDFIAPGLLAATAMQVAGNESMYPVLAAVKWIRTYFAMLATPLRVVDVLLGHVGWIVVRLVLVGTIYLGVMAAFDTVHSVLAVAALPAAVLTGLAFATPISAFAAGQQNDTGFTTIYRFGLIPLFLFSGTFFPVSQLPGWLHPIAAVTPLDHGGALCRALVLGQAEWWPSLGDALYLAGLTAIGMVLAKAAYERRLVQ